MARRLRIEVDAEPALISIVRHAIEMFLASQRWHRDDVEPFVFAISEAVSNCIEHAYPDAVGGRLWVELVDQPTLRGHARVQAIVGDRGRWRAVYDEERGNGFALMAAVTDGVWVDTGSSGTRVRMVSPVARLR